MEAQPEDLFRDALRLPLEERAMLITLLLESMDPEVDEGAHAAWDVEIERRLAEVRAGTVELVPWETARRRLRAH